jgi:UDP-glucose 4-epimerase
MKILMTGSSGHPGGDVGPHFAGLRARGRQPRPYRHPVISCVGSITDRACLRRCVREMRVVFHTATLHKPHLATHSRQAFVGTNIIGTLHLLEEAVRASIESFVYTRTTSVFGDTLVPDPKSARPRG